MAVTLKAIISKRANSDSSHTVFIRITKDRKYVVHSAGVRVDLKHWNEKGNYEKRNWIRASLNNAEQQNITIKKIIDKVTVVTSADPDVSLAQISILISGKEGIDFIQFWKDHMVIRNEHLSPSSKSKYVSHLNNFVNYNKDKAVPFSSITYEYICKYESFMLSKKAPTTCHRSLVFLRTIVMEAMRSGHIKSDPFRDFKMKHYKTNKERLSPEEIAVFENNAAILPVTQHSVNLFLIQYYAAGARVSDVIQMRWENITDGRWSYTMGKTNTKKNIKLNDRAISILGQYKKQKHGYVFPFLKDEDISIHGDRFHKKIESVTAQINTNLKLFAAKNEIDKNIHTHMARHSFADNARKLTKDVYAISKALGHKSISTTEKYLASFDDGAVDELMDQMG
jgi:integrase/recombinase XerD